MITNRDKMGWLLVLVLIALGLTAMPGSNLSTAKAADSCDQSFQSETGMSGAPDKVFSYKAAETCVRMTLTANQDAIVAAGDFARIVLDNGAGTPPVVVHNTTHSLKALAGPGVYVGNPLNWGYAVIIDKGRSQCEFERRFAASQADFTGGQFPLTAWTGTAVCGPIAADLNVAFTKKTYVVGADGFADVIVRADRALMPGETATVTVTVPTGQPKVVTLTEAHQDSVIHTQSVGEYTFSFDDTAHHATVTKITVAVSNPSPIVGDDVTFNVTSQPVGMDIQIVLGNGQTGEVITPSALTAVYHNTNAVQWVAAVQNNGIWEEFARGNINPVARQAQPSCTPIPANSTWSEQKNAAGHLFVLTTNGNTPLRICGQLPTDVTMLIQGGSVQTHTNVLTFIAGPSPVDVTVMHGLIFGTKSCLAHAKAEQMRQAAIKDGNKLDVVELPPADTACPVTTPPPGQPATTKIYLPIVRMPAPEYKLPDPAIYNLSAPAGEPVSSQSTGDGKVYQVVGSVPTGFTFVAWGSIENQTLKIVGLRGQISIQLAGGAWAILRDKDAQAFYNNVKAQYGLTDYAPPPAW